MSKYYNKTINYTYLSLIFKSFSSSTDVVFIFFTQLNYSELITKCLRIYYNIILMHSIIIMQITINCLFVYFKYFFLNKYNINLCDSKLDHVHLIIEFVTYYFLFIMDPY